MLLSPTEGASAHLQLLAKAGRMLQSRELRRRLAKARPPAAALEEMARRYEAAWLHEPIPALAGHTPRECANDPSRRPDLIRLLDSFPQDTGQPGTMSPARLRAALGLN